MLRHIRNSIAHGRIKKNAGDILVLKDCNTTKDTMEGKIPSKLLFLLIDILIKSRSYKLAQPETEIIHQL